jgi:multiple antibiotic resistance protein
LESWSHHIAFLVTLIAVLDPFMAIPFFLGVCEGRPEAERRRIARVASLTVMAILVGAAVSGEALLQLLGTSLASFRIAGGLVLLLMALAMLQAQPGNVRQTEQEASDASGQETPGIVPLAIPLLAGPGAISTVMMAAQDGGWRNQAGVIAGIVFVCLLLWSMLRLAIPIGNRMGSGGFGVATRLLGLLLAAIAVESMAVGLKELFPALGVS